jgi:hypothetical protein
MTRDVNGDFTTMGTPTDALKMGPTMPPAFNLHAFARDSGFTGGLVVSPDTVLEAVTNVSWSGAGLDLVEMNVIRQIDGVSPVGMLEAAIGMSRDELHVMLAMMMARGLVRALRDVQRFDSEPASGVFETVAEADGELFAQVG